MKTIFHGKASVEVIEPTEKAIIEYGINCGYDIIPISEKHMQCLNEGKIIAFDDGEYSNFLIKEGIEIKE